MLGFTAEEMVLVRLTMAAWMLCTNDHSLYEIMLGAAPYMPPAAQIVQDLDDVGRLMPSDVTTKSFPPATLTKAEVWGPWPRSSRARLGRRSSARSAASRCVACAGDSSWLRGR